MSDEQRISELLEEALASNRTPEQVCEHDPHLLPQVRARWEQLRSIEAQIDAIFPPDRDLPNP